MLLQAIRINRGQVWFVSEPEELTKWKLKEDTRLIAKTRPYLIVSANIINEKEIILQGFPITSNTNVRNDDILFMEPNGQTCKLVMDQLTPIEEKRIQWNTGYMYTMPDEIMDMVDSIIEKRLGLGTRFRNLDTKVRALRSTLDGLERAAGDVVNKLATSSQVSPVKCKSPALTKFENRVEKTRAYQAETSKNTIAPPEDKPSDTKKHTRIRWTKELAQQFINDYETAGKEEIKRKYSLQSDSSVYTTAYYLKNRYGKKDDSQ